LRGLQHKLLGLKKTPSEKIVFNESRTFTWGGFAILFLLLSTATPLTLTWFDLTLATLLLHNSAGALFRSDTLWSLFPWGCLNPNRFTLVAMPSFLGGINLGVERAVGAMLVVSGSVSLFPFPFLSMMSVLARRRAAFELDAIDGAVVGRRLKPNDVETPFVWSDCFLDKSLSSSPGLWICPCFCIFVGLLCAAAAEAAKAPAALRDMHCPMRAQPTFCFESFSNF
jgi:hypothetical protein